MKFKSLLHLLALGGTLLFTLPGALAQTTLISTNTMWRYLANGSDQGTAWRGTAFDDSGWASGVPLFGTESPGIYPWPIRTPMAVGGGRITYYFRTHFAVGSPTFTNLTASGYFDDGAVFYVNGAEAGRVRVTADPVAFDSLASSSSIEGPLEVVDLAVSNLVAGDNFIAVELHQFSIGSSDAIFGMTLEGTVGAVATPQLYINEWLADNTNGVVDPADGQHDDWFEIYNPGTNAVSLDGYFLTDIMTNQFKFQIPPGYTVPPGGYRLVWADNQPQQNSTNSPDLHVNVVLSADGVDGQIIGLSAADGTVIDAITIGAQTPDVSEGRWPDGGINRYFMTQTTPGAANVLGAALDCCCLPGQNLVVNGSFESPVVSPINDFDFFTGVLGWTGTDPSSSIVSVELWNGNPGGITAAQDGAQHLEINAAIADERVSQVVNGLIPGFRYTFCFWYTGRPGYTNNSFRAQIIEGVSAVVLSFYDDPAQYPAPWPAINGWYHYTGSFTPTLSTVTVRFTGTSTAGVDAGAHIDNVCIARLQQAPTVVCAPDKTVECGTVWDFEAPQATDPCTGVALPATVVSTTTISGPCPQVIERVWQITSASGGTAICRQKVTVRDTTPPVIYCTEFSVLCGTPWTFTPPYADDSCCGSNVTVTALSTTNYGTCPQYFERVWQATDCCGNTAVCTQTVTVYDITPPVFTTHCTTNHYDVGTHDNFSGAEATSPSPGLVARLQAMGAVFKGFDNCTTERFVAHTFTNLPPCLTKATVTVRLKTCGTSLCGNDTFGFSFTDPYGQLVAGSGSWSKTLGSLVTGDWCDYTGGNTFVFDLAALPAGGGATDLIASMNQNGFLDVTLQDDSAVDYITLDVVSCCCGTNRTVECGTDWTFETPTAIDACCTNDVIITALSTVTNFISDCRQTITRTWQAIDCCSNTAICLEVINVVDTTPPVFVWGSPSVNLVPNGSFETGVPPFNQANQLIQLLVGASDLSVWTIVQTGIAPLYWANGSHSSSLGTAYGPAADGDLYLYFNGSYDNSTPRGRITTSVNFPTAGSYRLEYDLWSEPSMNGSRDAGFAVDLVGPASFSYTDRFTPPFSLNAIPPTVTAANWQHVVHDFTVVTPGVYALSFTDASIYGNPNLPNAGNTPSPLLDNVSITANCCGSQRIVECGTPWNFAEPTAFDTCCTNVTMTSLVGGNGNICSIVYTMISTATDCCSNSITCTQTVIVVDTTAPVVTCPADKTVECGSGWTFDRPTAYDLCCGTNVSIVPILPPLPAQGSCPWTNIQDWVVTDCCGNSVICRQTVTVVDTMRPILHCPEIIKVTTCSNSVPVYYHVVATDNCDTSVQVVCTPPAPGPFPLGTTIINCTATDDCGNTTACSFPVVIAPGTNFWQWFPAGTRDCYANTYEPASPGPCLQGTYPGACWKWFDDPKVNCFLGHTWNLPSYATYTDGYLITQMKDYDCQGIPQNDTIQLGLLNCATPTWAWGRALSSLGADLGLPSTDPWCNISNWGPQFVLHLSDLPPLGGGNSVLPIINAPANGLPGDRRLDMLVQDDTRVDYAWLRMRRCPPQHIIGGLETTVSNAVVAYGSNLWSLRPDPQLGNPASYSASLSLGYTDGAALTLGTAALMQSSNGAVSVQLRSFMPNGGTHSLGFRITMEGRDGVFTPTASSAPSGSILTLRNHGATVLTQTFGPGVLPPAFLSTNGYDGVCITFQGGTNATLQLDSTTEISGAFGSVQADKITISVADSMTWIRGVCPGALDVTATGVAEVALSQIRIGVAGLVDPADGQYDDWFASGSGGVLACVEKDKLALSSLDAEGPGVMRIEARPSNTAPEGTFNDVNNLQATIQTSFGQFSPVPSNASLSLAVLVEEDAWAIAVNFCTEQGFLWGVSASYNNAPLPLASVQVLNNGTNVISVSNPASVSVSELPTVYGPSITWRADADICHRLLYGGAVVVRINDTAYMGTELLVMTPTNGSPVTALRGFSAQVTGAEALVLASFTTGPLPECVEPPDGLANWWTFDEKAGASAHDIAGAKDNIGNLLPFGSTVPSHVPGKVKNALRFNGTDQWMEVADQASLGEIDFAGTCLPGVVEVSFTIDAWIKPDPATGTAMILDKRDASRRGYALSLNNGFLRVELNDGTGHAYQGTYPITPNQWHFIAISYERCATVLKMYVDGSLTPVDTFNTPALGVLANSEKLFVARQRGPLGPPNFYAGCLDELEFFKRVLSDDEIHSLWTAGSLGKCKPGMNVPPYQLAAASAVAGQLRLAWSGDDAVLQSADILNGSLTTWTDVETATTGFRPEMADPRKFYRLIYR